MNDEELRQRADRSQTAEDILRIIVEVDLNGMLSDKFQIKDYLMHRARAIIATPDTSVYQEIGDIRRLMKEVQDMGVELNY